MVFWSLDHFSNILTFKAEKQIKSFSVHTGPVSRVAVHPKMPVIATASDDHTWKLWSVPQGELVLSGEGHRDWISDIAFHHKGNLIGTTSGDKTVKLWDISREK